MKTLACIALVLSLTVVSGFMSDYDRLYSFLFASYNRELAPHRNVNSSVKVAFGLAPLCLDMTRDGIVRGRVWYKFTWDDERLAFKPEEFGGIDVIRINPHKLWIPDLVLYNRDDSFNPMFPERTTASNVLIYSNGNILWVPDVSIEARCPLEGLNMDEPWADQKCSLKYGSWTFDGNKVNLQIYADQQKLDISDYNDNCPMEIVNSKVTREDKYYECCKEPYPNLQFNITMRRRFMVTENGVIRNPRKPHTDEL